MVRRRKAHPAGVIAREAAKRQRIATIAELRAMLPSNVSYGDSRALLADEIQIRQAYGPGSPHRMERLERARADVERLDAAQVERRERRVAANRPRRKVRSAPNVAQVLDKLAALRSRQLVLEDELEQAIRQARKSAATWEEIGALFNVHPETARYRWGRSR